MTQQIRSSNGGATEFSAEINPFPLHLCGPDLAYPIIVMNARVQRSTEPFEGLVPKRRAASCRPAASTRPNASVFPGPLTWQDESLPIEIAEGPSEYKVILPLCGIDPRKIHVLAMPRSLLIEICFKSSVRHQVTNAFVTESVDRRISREFSLPIEIEKGATTVQVWGECLHITARKSEHDQQPPWSHLIHFNTRASLGCV
jgi:HSP20 family molecular chaperone IbpA